MYIMHSNKKNLKKKKKKKDKDKEIYNWRWKAKMRWMKEKNCNTKNAKKGSILVQEIYKESPSKASKNEKRK